MASNRYGILMVWAIKCFLGGLVAVTSAEQSRVAAADSGSLRVYVGTYTRGDSRGIYLCKLDLATGQLHAPEVAGEVASPSFLAVHPSRPLLYAVSETSSFAGKKSGAVSGFSIDASTGKLTLLGQQPSQGEGPCHLTVDASGHYVLVANYGGGNIACLAIEEDGRPGKATSFIQHRGASVNPKRQQGPHAHWIGLDAASHFAFVADLGLDKVLIYRFDASGGRLSPNDPPWASLPAGAGPRHVAFHPSGRYAYVINELSCTVSVFSFDEKRGALQPVQALTTLPQGFDGSNTTAEVFVHPSGKFLYGSNRGHNSIVAFAVNPDTGKLTPIEHESTQGKTPRNFAIDPTGNYLLAANQDSDNIVVFRIDTTTGKLQETGSSVKVPAPVCVTLLRPSS